MDAGETGGGGGSGVGVAAGLTEVSRCGEAALVSHLHVRTGDRDGFTS